LLSAIALPQTVDRAQRVDAVFVALNKKDSPGCALAIVQDAKIIYERGYGNTSGIRDFFELLDLGGNRVEDSFSLTPALETFQLPPLKSQELFVSHFTTTRLFSASTMSPVSI
jgi:hypothetical protein